MRSCRSASLFCYIGIVRCRLTSRLKSSPAICAALSFEAHEHQKIIGVDEVMTNIALEARDRQQFTTVRRGIRRLRLKVNASMV